MPLILGIYILTIASISPAKAVCDVGCDSPINVYEQLKCTPKYEHPSDCCPKEYDCSHILNLPEGTCHLRGKLYKLGEDVPPEERAENCFYHCQCAENMEFKCLTHHQGCHEYYVPNYPKEGCYLRYALDSCCATDQICPPFDNVRKCEVNGEVYKEGQRFPHPKTKCTKCVCSQGFDGEFSEPFCQKKNCTTEIQYSKKIHKYCAPYYIGGTCCPAWWICPSEDGKYITSQNTENSVSDPKCKFGDKEMDIGSKYLHQAQYTSKVICECIVPPFLSCFEQAGE